MPLSQDPLGGGTEVDGKLSTEYCSYCYVNGAFITPNLTLEEMVAWIEPIMEPMGLPPEVVAQTKAILPTLKRWRTPA